MKLKKVDNALISDYEKIVLIFLLDVQTTDFSINYLTAI